MNTERTNPKMYFVRMPDSVDFIIREIHTNSNWRVLLLNISLINEQYVSKNR